MFCDRVSSFTNCEIIRDTQFFLQRHFISYRSSNILLRFEIFAPDFFFENCNHFEYFLKIKANFGER